jgi:hypothetical protein
MWSGFRGGFSGWGGEYLDYVLLVVEGRLDQEDLPEVAVADFGEQRVTVMLGAWRLGCH